MHKLVKLSIASCIAVAAIGSATAATLQLNVDNTKAAANTYSIMSINGTCSTSPFGHPPKSTGYTQGTFASTTNVDSALVSILCIGAVDKCPIKLYQTSNKPTGDGSACASATSLGSLDLDADAIGKSGATVKLITGITPNPKYNNPFTISEPSSQNTQLNITINKLT